MNFSKLFLVSVLLFGLVSLAGCPKEDDDGYCGDGECDRPGGEDHSVCPEDCQPTCGDGSCDTGETSQNCSDDCQAQAQCGDGVCNGTETSSSCPGDCSASVCTDPNYPVDCHDDSGVCWSLGTNCDSNWFSCGGGLWRCTDTTYEGFCCLDTAVQCPASAPYFCPQDGLCYGSGGLPGYCNVNVCSLILFDC